MSPKRTVRSAAQALADGVLWTFDLRRWGIYLKKRFRQGYTRSLGSLVPVLQAATASALAYLIAEVLFLHRTPIFAAITAWICLGYSRNRRPRKVAEMGAGVAIGVLFGETFGHYFGIGAWQIFAILIAAPLVARFLDRGELFTVQAAINSLAILAIATVGFEDVFMRWGDAVIGAVVAFVFAVVLPRNVTSRPRRYLRVILAELSEALADAANGLGWGDIEAIYDVQASLRSLEQTLTDGHAALRTASEVTRLNRSLRRDREIVTELKRLFTLVDRTTITTQAIVRQSSGVVAEHGRMPEVSDLLTHASETIKLLSKSITAWEPPVAARELAEQLAEKCRPSDVQDEDWRALVLLTLMRSISIDLLQMCGFTRAEARAMLPETGKAQTTQEEDPELDEQDTLWAPRDDNDENE